MSAEKEKLAAMGVTEQDILDVAKVVHTGVLMVLRKRNLPNQLMEDAALHAANEAMRIVTLVLVEA